MASTDDHVELDDMHEVDVEAGEETKAGPDATTDATAIDTKADPDAKKDDVAPAPPPFRFFHLLRTIHAMVVALPGFHRFALQYALLQSVRLAAAVSILFLPLVLGDEFDVAHVTRAEYAALGCFGALQLLGRLAPFATRLIVDKFKEALQAAQATAVVAKLFDLQHDAMLSTPTGELAQLIGKVFRNLDPLLPALYGAVLPLTVETAFAVAFIALAYGPVALGLLALFAAYTLVAYSAAAQKAQRNREMMAAVLSGWGEILATVGSYERAHFFGNVDREVGVARRAFERIGAQVTAVASGEHREGIALTALTLCCTMAIGLATPAVVDVSGVELISLVFYLVMYVGSLDVYATAISNLRTAVFEYQAFDEFLGRRSEVRDDAGAVELAAPRAGAPGHEIEFDRVSFSYGGKLILDDVSFKLAPGATLGVVGASGCGKSTVLRLLLRFYRPSRGVIRVDGRDIARASGASLRRLFSVVTQDAQLFGGSVRENIAYGRVGAADAEILEAARLAGLPLGGAGADLQLDKPCGERGGKLSGGQQQRVALARAMLKNGSMYLLDEPTTGLDGVVAAQLQETLDALTADATTICITHHLADLKRADHIIYLDGGRIVEQGDFDALMRAEGEFYKQIEARGSK